MAYDELFDDEPLDQDALIASLGGQPPPQTIPPEEIAKLKALLAKAQLPTTPSSRQVLESVKPAEPFVGPVQPHEMRAATKKERLLSPDRDVAMEREFFKPSPGQPTTMRAPTWSERLRDTTADVFEGASQQPLGRLADLFGVSDLAGSAKQLRGEEPAPDVMGAMPDLPGKTGGAKLAKKEARAVLKELFPELDAYAKKKGFLKPDQIMASLKAHPGATPEMITRAEGIVAQGKKLKPAEVVDVLSGVKHERGRVLRKGVSQVTTKKVSGAPLWVTSPKKEEEALENYLAQLEAGVAGRGFYRESGKSILSHTGDDPALAHKFGRAMSATSPATEVSVNTGFGIKGHNQAIAGEPVVTGRWPTNMSPSIEQTYKGEIADLGPKREPFAKQLAIGGEYADEGEKTARAVHDIWEGEAFGYVNPDGTPLRRGFNDAEHKWMDKMTDRAIAEANRRQIGGHSDWDTGTSQAAAWTGARIRAGEIEPGDAAKSFADFMNRYYLQTGREAVPGITTKHLPELAQAPLEMRQEYARKVGDILYDVMGREKSAMQKGMLTGGSLEGPGVWKDAAGIHVHPGRQVRQVAGTGTDKATGAKMLDPSSERLIKGNEAEYGLLMGQDAIAGSMLDPGAKKAARDSFDLMLPTGSLQMQDNLLAHPSLKAALQADQVAVMPTDGGARVLNLGMESSAFDTFMRDLAKTTPGSKAVPGKNLGFYEGNAWDAPEGAVGQSYAKLIKGTPTGIEGFNKSAPEVAKQLNALDTYMRDTHKMTLSDTLMQLREAIAAKGFDGVNELAAKLGVPLAALLLLLRTEEQPQAPVQPPG